MGLGGATITGGTEYALPLAIDKARAQWERDQAEYRAWMWNALESIDRRLARIEKKLYD